MYAEAEPAFANSLAVDGLAVAEIGSIFTVRTVDPVEEARLGCPLGNEMFRSESAGPGRPWTVNESLIAV